ncbi:MAG: gamma-glutamyl-phosphate reductase, partial [Clostridia bacterium]|nr:gamma-glutamyl-phosphate reductase [Clostridia bacterium]
MTTIEILQKAKAYSPELAILDTETKNKALSAMADAIEAAADKILEANALDVDAAKETLGEVMTDRLSLNNDRIRT